MSLASGGSSRRTGVKATQQQLRDAEAARRRAALATQQSEGRASRIADVRRVAMETLLATEDQDDDVEVEIEEDAEDDDAEMAANSNKISGKKMRRLRRLHRTLFFARQLQNPDWLLDMPPDLSTNWLLQVRPEGDRYLLLSDGGNVQIRRKNGHLYERYKDARFPHGLTILDVIAVEPPQVPVPSAGGGGGGVVVAAGGRGGVAEEADGDAMMDDDDAGAPAAPAAGASPPEAPGGDVEMGGGGRGAGVGRGYGRGGGGGRGRGGRGKGAGKGDGGGGRGARARPVGDRKYAVCDVLVWGGTDLATADAECRMFWLESRFSELPAEKPSRRARALMLTPTYPATPENLSKCYHTELDLVKDNFLFLHREGHYHTCEPVTPLALMWRDRQISRWVIDTPDKEATKVPERQAVVLEVRNQGRLRTADRVVVGQLDEQQMGQVKEMAHSNVARGKTMVRLEASAVDVASRQVAIARVVSVVGARSRAWPDSWGRIAFQHLQRLGQTQHISFQALMRAAIGEVGPVAGEVK